MNVQNIRTQQSMLTLANTTELATRIIKDISGNEIANSLNGNLLTSDALRALIVSRIQHNISKLEVAKF